MNTRPTRHHYLALLSIGIPIMIGQMGMIVLSFADTMMVGHHSTIELGAASFVNSIVNLVIIAGTGFSYGLTPIVGGAFGRRELAQAGSALRSALVANTLAAAVMVLALGTLYLFVDRLGQPDELMPYIRPYYLVLLASLPFVMLNILGNYLLIYGKAGFPELGVVGAGVSTLFSRIYMVVMFCIVFWTRRTFAAYREGFAGLGWSRSVVRRLVAIGSPIALEMGMETAAFSLTVIMVGWIGTIALASHQVMTTISQFTFMVYYGLGAAVAVRVSYFHGQSDHQGTRQTVIAGLHLMVALELLLGGIIFLLRYDIGSWFTDSSAVTSGVVSLMLPFFIYQFGDGLQITYANALRGIADVKPLVVIAFIAFFVISLPLSYVFAFPLGYGLVGVWMAFPFGLTTAGVMMWWRFRSQMKALDKSPKA